MLLPARNNMSEPDDKPIIGVGAKHSNWFKKGNQISKGVHTLRPQPYSKLRVSLREFLTNHDIELVRQKLTGILKNGEPKEQIAAAKLVLEYALTKLTQNIAVAAIDPAQAAEIIANKVEEAIGRFEDPDEPIKP